MKNFIPTPLELAYVNANRELTLLKGLDLTRKNDLWGIVLPSNIIVKLTCERYNSCSWQHVKDIIESITYNDVPCIVPKKSYIPRRQIAVEKTKFETTACILKRYQIKVSCHSLGRILCEEDFSFDPFFNIDEWTLDAPTATLNVTNAGFDAQNSEIRYFDWDLKSTGCKRIAFMLSRDTPETVIRMPLPMVYLTNKGFYVSNDLDLSFQNNLWGILNFDGVALALKKNFLATATGQTMTDLNWKKISEFAKKVNLNNPHQCWLPASKSLEFDDYFIKLFAQCILILNENNIDAEEIKEDEILTSESCNCSGTRTYLDKYAGNYVHKLDIALRKFNVTPKSEISKNIRAALEFQNL